MNSKLYGHDLSWTRSLSKQFKKLNKNFKRVIAFVISVLLLHITFSIFYRSRKHDESMVSDRSTQEDSIDAKLKKAAETRVDTETTFGSLNPNWKPILNPLETRDVTIHVRHVCLDPEGKLFLPEFEKDGVNTSIADPPNINIAGSASSMDVWFQLEKRKVDAAEQVQLVGTRDLFLAGGVWEYHLSHFFMNNALPIINLLNQYYEDTGLDWMNLPRDLYTVNMGNPFDLDSLNFTNVWSDAESRMPKSKGIQITQCYKNAVIGLRNACDCCGCVHDLEDDKRVYNQMRELVFRHHLTPEEYDQAKKLSAMPYKERPFKMIIVQRKSSRRILNLDAIESYLKSRNIDYEIKSLEDHSFQEQVRMFALGPTAYLTAHGNALGNSFWMPPNSLIIEGHSYNQNSAWFEHFFGDSGSGSKGHPLRYVVLKCKDLACNHDAPSAFSADFDVSIEKLDVILDNFYMHDA